MRKSLKSFVVTALAVAAMSVTVLGSSYTNTDTVKITPDTCWTSKSPGYTSSAYHTITTDFQKTYEKGKMHFEIAAKVLGTYFADAEADVAITKAYGGVRVSFGLDGKVSKSDKRYYYIAGDETASFVLSSFKDEW